MSARLVLVSASLLPTVLFSPMQLFRLLLIVLFTICASPAQALTITQSYSVAEQYTDWTQAFSFEKFNPGLGDLTAVEVDFSTLMHNTASFGYSGSGSGRFLAKFTNNFTLSDWNAEDITSSRAGSSTRWVQHKNTAQSYDFDIGANTVMGELDLSSYLDSFIGGGTIGLSLSVSTLFTFSNSGSGISLLDALTASTAQLSVIYTYLPAPAPAPAPDMAPAPDEAYSAPVIPLLPSAPDDSEALPEPSAPALLALGLVILAGTKRRTSGGSLLQQQQA